MDKEKKVTKVKCKNCRTVLTTEVKAFQTCQCEKVMFDTINCLRVVGNREDYEITAE